MENETDLWPSISSANSVRFHLLPWSASANAISFGPKAAFGVGAGAAELAADEISAGVASALLELPEQPTASPISMMTTTNSFTISDLLGSQNTNAGTHL